jgi:uncharacterized membrane protein
MSVFFLITAVVSIIGLCIAYYIHTTKQKNETLVCPLEGSCDSVVQSSYSKFLGVPVELMGVLYYLFTAIGYLLIFFAVIPYTPLISFLSVWFAVSGALFSAYLVAVQGLVLREWCTWCVFSAIASFIVAILSVYVSELGFIPILVEYKQVVVILHALTAALGVGGALITDIFFFKFLKDYRIAGNESETLQTFSQVMWVALTGLVVTGALLFLTNIEGYMASSKFITKMLAVLVIGVNGGVLNLIISPRIQEITFGGEHTHKDGELSRYRKIAFTTGAISISSWLLVFVLGSLRSIPYTAGQGISLYVAVLAVSVLASQIYAHLLSKKA